VTIDNAKPPAAKQSSLSAVKPEVPINIAPEQKIFVANFRKARQAAHLSQRDIHQRTGIAQSYLSEVERCLCNPSLDILSKLAAVVDQPLHLLLKP
jgi:DNA-binding XRE family transcriptional regulator